MKTFEKFLTEKPKDADFGDDFTSRNRRQIKKILSNIGKDPKGTAKKVTDDAAKNITSPKPDDVAKEKSILRNFNKKNSPNNPEYQKLLNQKRRIQQQFDAADDSDAGNPNPDSKQRQPNPQKPKKFSSGATGTTPSGSPEMGGESKKFVKNRRTPLKTKVLKPKTKNQKPKNKTLLKRGFEDVTGENIKSADIPKTKAELLKKRQEYGITYDKKLKQTTITKDGLEKFTRKSLNKKQIESGSNEPIKLTKADLNKARERVIGGRQIKDSKGKVIGTTTGKYGGKVSGEGGMNFKNFKDKVSKVTSKVKVNTNKFFKKTQPLKNTNKFLKKTKPFKKMGKFAWRNKGTLALAGLVAAPYIKDYFDKKNLKRQGREKISPLNTTSSKPITDRSGNPVKFGFGTQGKPEGTQGNLFNPKVKSQVLKKIESGEYKVKKK